MKAASYLAYSHCYFVRQILNRNCYLLSHASEAVAKICY